MRPGPAKAMEDRLLIRARRASSVVFPLLVIMIAMRLMPDNFALAQLIISMLPILGILGRCNQ